MKTLLAFGLACAASAASAALAAGDADLARCRAVADASARLACYDALSPSAAPGAAPAAVPAPAVAPVLAPVAQFGLDRRVIETPVEQIDSRVLGLFEGWGPKSRIKLENGQVWQVTDDSRAVIDKTNPVVHVVRGAMGTFFLEVEGRNQTARVKRVE